VSKFTIIGDPEFESGSEVSDESSLQPLSIKRTLSKMNIPSNRIEYNTVCPLYKNLIKKPFNKFWERFNFDKGFRHIYAMYRLKALEFMEN
tara:strand:- start:266 stop:538 length:273 start_codon:yes stop_codon:yes gene_type:complete